jgi:hypothetical protein
VTEPELEAERIQDCLDRLAAGETVDALRADAGIGPEVVRLALLAQRMRVLLPTTAPPQFRARLQASLQAELAPRRRTWGLAWLLPRLAAVMLAISLVFGSAVVASAASLPGDPLYGLKRAGEELRLVFATNPAARAALQLELADARLAEMRALGRHGKPVTDRLVRDLAAAHAAALDAAQAAGDAALVASVNQRVSDQDSAAQTILSGGRADNSHDAAPNAPTTAPTAAVGAQSNTAVPTSPSLGLSALTPTASARPAGATVVPPAVQPSTMPPAAPTESDAGGSVSGGSTHPTQPSSGGAATSEPPTPAPTSSSVDRRATERFLNPPTTPQPSPTFRRPRHGEPPGTSEPPSGHPVPPTNVPPEPSQAPPPPNTARP